jgi:hypothetical protein
MATGLAFLFRLRSTPGYIPKDSTRMSAALAKEIDENEIDTIEQELKQATKRLKELQEREEFLGLRANKYRIALEEQARHLREQEARLGRGSEDKDETARADLKSRLKKWAKDEIALDSIEETHGKIVIRCERMRCDIRKLERRRDHLYHFQQGDGGAISEEKFSEKKYGIEQDPFYNYPVD